MKIGTYMMNKRTIIVSCLSLLIGFSSQSQATETSETYDFSPEKSIWGSGPTRNIEPENAVKENNGDYVNPFDTIDLSGLNMERKITISQKEIKLEIRRTRVIRKTAPLLFDDSHSHLGFNFSGGVSALKFDSEFGDNAKKFSPTFGFSYLYFFHQHWGAGLGLNLNWSTSGFKSKKTFTDNNTYTDYEGDKLSTSYSIKKIDERFKTTMLTLPITVWYDRKDWLLGAGFKFGFPFKMKYEQILDDIDINGEYPFSFPISSTSPIGTGHWDIMKYKGSFSGTPVYVMLTGDFGRKFRINDALDIAISVYGDYALNGAEMRSKNDASNAQHEYGRDIYSLIENTHVNSGADLPVKTMHASTLCSEQMSSGKRLVEGFHYYNYGLKFTVYFSSYGNDSEEGQAIINRLAGEAK